MEKILAIVALAVLAAGCTEPDHARKVLENAGYTNIQTGGYRWFMCAEEDWYHTGFVAVGPTGKPVTGCVCDGLLFKGATIRLD